MEQNQVLQENVVNLINRSVLSITGLTKVVSVSETMLCLEAYGSGLTILGANIQISKLDVENGTISATGEFDAIKYSESKNKNGLLKRIFK